MILYVLCRFYDLTSGSLTLEQQDIKGLNLPLVRSHLGIVSQVTYCIKVVSDEKEGG